ncbi:MAG TPA: hypothetical protein VLD35_13455 [Caldimonas sp.]|nr:hypothetical protein [Caldimonas sp.]
MTAAKKTPKPGLYANIHAKQERIAHGSGEKMRKPGSPGSPSEAAFDAAAGKKTVKKAANRATPSKKAAQRAPSKKTSGKTARKR